MVRRTYSFSLPSTLWENVEFSRDDDTCMLLDSLAIGDRLRVQV